MGNKDMELLVAIHELIEQRLCEKRNIPESAITAFDMEFETANKGEYDEPGLDPSAPYHKEHMVADAFERAAAIALGVDWNDYEAAIDKLFE